MVFLAALLPVLACALALHAVFPEGAGDVRVSRAAQPALPGPVPKPPAAERRDAGRAGDAGFDADALRARLEGIFGRHAGRYGAVVYDPASGTTVSVGADERFYAASIGKLPTLLALYRAAADGEMDLGSRVRMLPRDVRAEGSGILHTWPPYTAMTLRECAYYLVAESDNTAWVMLERTLGVARIEAGLERLGARDTDYAARTTTPNDVLLVLRAVSDPEYTSAEHLREMLAAMTDTAYEDRIPAPLPSDVRVAHKVGSYGDSFGDAGVVYYEDRRGREKRYYLVVMSSGAPEAEARAAIQASSLAAYEALALPNR